MDTALLIIDMQIGLLETAYRRESVFDNIKQLLAQARGREVPVIYVQHDGPRGHGLEVETHPWRIHPSIAPRQGEVIIHKRASDSFYRTTLQQELERRGVKHLVVVGGQTEYCVDTTVRRALTQGYEVTLVGDAHTTEDNEYLSAAEAIAYHNYLLDGFRVDTCRITVKPTSAIIF